MRIGIDIDDTITNSWEYLIPYYAKMFNIDTSKLSKSKPYYQAIKDYISLDEYYKILVPIHNKYTSKIPLKENVKEVIDKLYELGHTVYFITDRGNKDDDAYNITKEYLDNYGIKYEKIYTRASDKAVICLKENIKLYIDDSIKHCANVASKGIEVLMFDTNYNKEYKAFNRVHSWNEIYEYIKDRWWYVQKWNFKQRTTRRR